MAGPLAGYRIVDLTQMVSGPMATMILGDQGADVIKVEPRGGDLTRALGGAGDGLAPLFVTTNRNKRSLVVDLKQPRGVELLKRLVARADVFVQNFRPGAVERLGLGEPELRAERPDLVYVSISGFGESGPYAQQRVYDPVIQALSGLASIQGDPTTGRPRMIRLIVPDKVTALTAAQAITAALLARERTGRGQHVRLAMLDAVIAFLWPEGMTAHTFVDRRHDATRPLETRDLVFETVDGYLTAGAVSDAEWAGLARALEHPEWTDDPRFATPVARIRNANARLDQTAEVLRTRSTGEWLARLRAEGVPSAPVLAREQVIDDPQVRANGVIVESVHPRAGRMRQPRPAARFAETPSAIRRAAPVAGEHTDEVLREVGFSGEAIRELRAGGVVA
jgi:crotonobetainyl-CoA:carnitine CoA-transferase CaiB-like acyl-CoA transferase